MSDEQSKWKIDLDNKDFLTKSGEALKSILQLGEPGNLLGLAIGFTKANAALALMSAAVVALKATMETVFSAEEIKAVNAQFEIMSKNAGLVGANLKEGLSKAAGGLVDDTELLQAANKAIVTMGEKAEKLPEIMELARKSSNVMGTDLLSTFEQLNHAIGTGSQRQLKQLGIIVDTDKAYKKMAESLHVGVNELSEAGKKQAVLNEVLEKGNKQFQGVDDSSKQATNAYKRIGIALHDIGDTLVMLFDKIVGPAVRATLDKIAEWTGKTARLMKATFGDGVEKIDAQLGRLKDRSNEYNEEMANVAINAQKRGMDVTAPIFQERIKHFKNLIAKTNEEIEALEAKRHKLVPEEGVKKTGGEDSSKEDMVDKEKSLERQRKFEADLFALKKTRMEDEKNNLAELGEDDWRLKQEQAERKHMIDVEFDLKRRELAEKYKNDEQMQRDLEVELEANHQQKLIEIDEQASQRKIDILNKQTDKSKNAAEGIKNAFKAGAEENRKDLTNWGKTGKMVFGTFSKHSKQALLDFGAGTKTASEAMKGFMFGGIADIAEAKGMELLLSSIWPPNPVGMAAGGGLVALAGMLRAQAGGGGGSGGVSSAGGGAAGEGSSSGATSVESSRPAEAEIQNKKSVTLQIMGNNFETEQGNRRLVEMIREASDATDFTVKQIGQV